MKKQSDALAAWVRSIEEATSEAKRLVALARNGSMQDFFRQPAVSALTVLAALAEVDDEAQQLLSEKASIFAKEIVSAQNRKNINKRHDQPGGTRDKRRQVRAAWASGKYRSRDRCAEAVASKLGISFSTARKALINAPNPSRSL